MLLQCGVAVLLGMVSSVSASNLLINPSFDNPVPLKSGVPDQPPHCDVVRDLQVVPGWYRLEEITGVLQRTGPLAFRNGFLFSPACPRDPEGDNDSIRASIEFCDVTVRKGMEQTVSNITPGVTMTFAGWWSLGTDQSPIPPDSSAFAHAELHDGPDGNGDPVASTTIEVTPTTMTNWQSFSITGTITGSDVTVRVWIISGTGLCQTIGFHLDECMLTEEVACHAPFADADEDGDVDGVDFASFQRCVTGDDADHPPIPGAPSYCACFNREGDDDDIDALDFEEFVNCITGPMVPHATHPNPLCSDPP